MYQMWNFKFLNTFLCMQYTLYIIQIEQECEIRWIFPSITHSLYALWFEKINKIHITLAFTYAWFALSPWNMIYMFQMFSMRVYVVCICKVRSRNKLPNYGKIFAMLLEPDTFSTFIRTTRRFSFYLMLPF